MERLTESEASRLNEKVGEIDFSDPVTQQWILESIANNSIEEKRLKAAYRFRQLMREDDKMKLIAADLDMVRRAGQCLEEMKEKCSGI